MEDILDFDLYEETMDEIDEEMDNTDDDVEPSDEELEETVVGYEWSLVECLECKFEFSIEDFTECPKCGAEL